MAPRVLGDHERDMFVTLQRLCNQLCTLVLSLLQVAQLDASLLVQIRILSSEDLAPQSKFSRFPGGDRCSYVFSVPKLDFFS
jgi:hypothetical protein